jgi:hypothetical protein
MLQQQRVESYQLDICHDSNFVLHQLPLRAHALQLPKPRSPMARSGEGHDLPKANLVSSQLKSTQIEGTMQTLSSTAEFRQQIAQELSSVLLEPAARHHR